MTMNSTEPGESLAAAESLADENAASKRPVLRAAAIVFAVFVALLILVELTGGSPTLIINGMMREAVAPQTAGVAIAVIGLVVELSPLVIPGDFKYAAALLILILLLLVRPQGLLGRAQRVG
jgi:branched-chain amino acid transport system permease protein